MIEKKIAIIVTDFIQNWNNLVEDHLRYRLDYTWASVALLDLILSPLEGRKDLKDQEIEMINGAAAYLAGIAFECWRGFADRPAIRVYFDDSNKLGVIIEAKRGLKGEDGLGYQLNISETLAKILSEPENPFPFYDKTSRHLPLTFNRINLFATGLVTGFCPYGTGLWREYREFDVLARVIFADDSLSTSTAKHYKKLYPTEHIGADASFYRVSLILPPVGHSERFPYLRSTINTSKRLKESCQEETEMAVVAKNIMLLADDCLSKTGFIILSALNTSSFKKQLGHFADEHAAILPTLWPALNIARKSFNKSSNFIELTQLYHQDGDPVILEQATEIAELDHNLGYLPLVRIPFHYLQYESFIPLFVALTLMQTTSAITLLETAESSTDISAQLAFLYLHKGEQSKVEQLLSAITIDNYCSLEIKGILAFERGDFELAGRLYQQALGLNPPAFTKKGLIEKIVLCLVKTKRHEEALTYLRKAKELVISANLAQIEISILRELSRTEEAEQLINELSYLTPYSRWFFAQVVSNKQLH